MRSSSGKSTGLYDGHYGPQPEGVTRYVDAMEGRLCKWHLPGQSGATGHVCGQPRRSHRHYCPEHAARLIQERS